MIDIEKLQVTLPSATEIRMERTFQAPRGLVFDCFTKPELLKRWFACRGFHLSVCEVDLRVGGHWRYVLSQPQRRDVGMGGEYLDIQAPERSVHTEAFDDFPGHSVVTGLFVEHAGCTQFTCTVRFESEEIRDQVLATGMSDGAGETYDNLAKLLAETTQSHRI